MLRTYHHSIEGFFPHKSKSGFGSFGFSIYLDPIIAKKFYETRVTPHMDKEFQDNAKCIIKEHFPKKECDNVLKPYVFHRGSLLIQLCKVPGNSCDIGIDPKPLEDFEA